MKDGVDGFHIEVLLNLNNKEVNHLLIRLQQVYRIITLTNQDLAIFIRKKLQEFLMNQSRMSEFKRTIH